MRGRYLVLLALYKQERLARLCRWKEGYYSAKANLIEERYSSAKDIPAWNKIFQAGISFVLTF